MKKLREIIGILSLVACDFSWPWSCLTWLWDLVFFYHCEPCIVIHIHLMDLLKRCFLEECFEMTCTSDVFQLKFCWFLTYMSDKKVLWMEFIIFWSARPMKKYSRWIVLIFDLDFWYKIVPHEFVVCISIKKLFLDGIWTAESPWISFSYIDSGCVLIHTYASYICSSHHQYLTCNDIYCKQCLSD